MNILQRCVNKEYELYRCEFLEVAKRVMESGRYLNGEEVKILQQAFINLTNKRYNIAVKNGTDALYIALKCLNISDGDEVLVPCNTFVADYLAVSNSGAKPISVDVNSFFNIDTDRLEEKITTKTKAVIAVHLYGQAADMDAINNVAARHNLFVIEDCAQALGSTYKGQPVGSFGDAACFSFYPTKNIGAFGDGGMICVNDVILAEKITAFKNYGMLDGLFVSYGVNSRMDDIQAGIINVKLSHMSELLRARLYIAEKYISGISNPALLLPKTACYTAHTYHQFVIMCEERDRLKRYLADNGIEAQVHYPIPPFSSVLYSNDGKSKLTDFSARVHEKILSLPIYVGLTDKEIDYVIDTVNNFR